MFSSALNYASANMFEVSVAERLSRYKRWYKRIPPFVASSQIVVLLSVLSLLLTTYIYIYIYIYVLIICLSYGLGRERGVLNQVSRSRMCGPRSEFQSGEVGRSPGCLNLWQVFFAAAQEPWLRFAGPSLSNAELQIRQSWPQLGGAPEQHRRGRVSTARAQKTRGSAVQVGIGHWAHKGASAGYSPCHVYRMRLGVVDRSDNPTRTASSPSRKQVLDTHHSRRVRLGNAGVTPQDARHQCQSASSEEWHGCLREGEAHCLGPSGSVAEDQTARSSQWITGVPLRRSALSICICGDARDRHLHWEKWNRLFLGPCEAPKGIHTEVTSAKGHFRAYPNIIILLLIIIITIIITTTNY